MISVNNVCFSYKTNADPKKPCEKAVISGFSLELDAGETVAVMGESGSGKTTLTRLLLGLEKPDSGSIEGLENRRVSVVFQEDRLLPWYSVKENVASVLKGMKKSERDEAAHGLIADMELSEAADKPIRELSGGMQRRVAIARALAFGGDLLILDEPLKGLDAELKKRIVPRIKKRFSTILLITHSEEEAELFGAKRIIRLN